MARQFALVAAATLLSLAPAALAAQVRDPGSTAPDGRVYVKVYVVLSDRGAPYATQENVPVTIYRVGGDSVVTATNAAGLADAYLRAGDYRVVTAGVSWRGKFYSWDIPIKVRAGIPAVELTLDNAQVDAPFSEGPAVKAQVDHAARPLVPEAAPPVPFGAEPKEGGTAFLLSFLIPGAGQMYSGEVGKGVGLLAANLVGGGLLIAGLSRSCDASTCHRNDGLVATGAALAAGTWIFSMADAPNAAHRHNRKLGIAMRPVVTPLPAGGMALGLALGGDPD